MKRLLTCFTGLLALTISGCALSSLLVATPEDVVNQTANCPTEGEAKAERFQVLSTQAWSQGVIVLYSAFCPTHDAHTPMRQVFGHKVVKRHGMAWQVSGSGSYGTDNESAASERLVEYGISRSLEPRHTNRISPNEAYTILYGRVLKPKVIAVEATFDNGKSLRYESSNGVFALLAAGATGVCELRILGADNQILRQEDLAVPKSLAIEGRSARRSARCLPTSHQL